MDGRPERWPAVCRPVVVWVHNATLLVRPFSAMKRIVLIMGAALTMASAATAQQPFQAVKNETLETPAGLLTVRKEVRPICEVADTCSVVRLGNTVLGNNWLAGLAGVYPSQQAPVFVSYFTNGGGACCLSVVAIVDVAVDPFFQLGALFLQSDYLEPPTVKDLGGGLFELSGENYERNKLGNRIRTTYLYDRHRRLVSKKPKRDESH